MFIKDMRNEITKQFKGPSDICNIFYAGMKNILLVTPSAVILFDTELKTTVSEIKVANVRHAFWSPDMSMVALLSKHSTSSYGVRTLTASDCDCQQAAGAAQPDARGDPRQERGLGRRRHFRVHDAEPHQIRAASGVS